MPPTTQPPQLQVQREPLEFVFLTAITATTPDWSVDRLVTLECRFGYVLPLVQTMHHSRFGQSEDSDRAVAHLVHQMGLPLHIHPSEFSEQLWGRVVCTWHGLW